MVLARLVSRLMLPRLPVSECRGDGRYAVVGAGEAEFQEAFIRICGPLGPKPADHHVSALLIPEHAPKNPHALRIEVAGRTVGRLGRADARRLRSHLTKLGYGVCIVAVAARIRGGVQKKRGQPKPYHVTLDLPAFIAGTPRARRTGGKAPAGPKRPKRAPYPKITVTIADPADDARGAP